MELSEENPCEYKHAGKIHTRNSFMLRAPLCINTHTVNTHSYAMYWTGLPYTEGHTHTQ